MEQQIIGEFLEVLRVELESKAVMVQAVAVVATPQMVA
jgi:hypothetical protein